MSHDASDPSVFDPDAWRCLETMARQRDLSTLSPAQARADRAASRAAMQRPLEDVGSIEDRELSFEDRSIPVRIYRPRDVKGAHPALVYLHGGGWVLGDLDGIDPLCRQLTNRIQATVISVDYRLAPEHKYPAAVNDAKESFLWAGENAESLGIDRARIAIGGDSAGANLATVACLELKGANLPLPVAQLLIYPVTHAHAEPSSYDVHLAPPGALSPRSMVWFADHYVSSKDQLDLPGVSPLLSFDLVGLPPAVFVTARFDILSPQSDAYANALVNAGVAVSSFAYDGVFHGFFAMAPIIEKASIALDEVSKAMRRLVEAPHEQQQP